MRKTLITVGLAVTALVLSGVAVATLQPSGTAAASATFSAGKVRSETRTCNGPDGRYEITSGRYVGTSTGSDEALTGPIELQVKTVYNVDKKLGWLEGWVKVRRGDDDRRSSGRLWATLGDAGAANGFVNGNAGHRYAALFSGLTATFSPATGFTNGKLGGGGAQVNAAVLAGRPCTGRTGVAVKLTVKGQVTALTDTSLTVSPRDGSPAQSCERKQGVSPSLDRIAVGTKVEMHCGLVDSKMTLLKIKKDD